MTALKINVEITWLFTPRKKSKIKSIQTRPVLDIKYFIFKH